MSLNNTSTKEDKATANAFIIFLALATVASLGYAMYERMAYYQLLHNGSKSGVSNSSSLGSSDTGNNSSANTGYIANNAAANNNLAPNTDNANSGSGNSIPAPNSTTAITPANNTAKP
jgi:hypothetical protein